MSSKKLEGHVQTLVGLGYSKTKALKALKDTNGDLASAKRMLVRQATAEKSPSAPTASAKAVTSAPVPYPKQSLATLVKAKEEDKPPPPKIPKHPCVYQYGHCRYGSHCQHAGLPGDVCINYLIGNCLYKDDCYWRHTLDGKDLKEPRPPETVKDPRTNIVYKLENGAAVQISAPPEDLPPSAPPTATDWTVSGGSTATRSEPLQPLGGATNLHADAIPHVPAPFLQKLLQGGSAPPPTMHPRPARVSAPITGGTVEPPIPRHPCVQQCGSCKYGDSCIHSHLPGDICVHWLNQGCRNGDRCRFRHSKEERRTPPPPGPWEQSYAPPPARPAPAPRQEPDRVVDLAPAHTELNDDLLVALTEDILAEEVDEPCPERDVPPPAAPPTDAAHTSLTAEQEAKFLRLIEVFPDSTPQSIFQYLTQFDFNERLVAEAVSQENQTFFSAAGLLAEERARSEKQANDLRESVTLLSLCALFPALEPATIGAVLLRCEGEFNLAVKALACSTENLVASDLSNAWSHVDPNAAQKLKLEKLLHMYGDLPSDVVKQCAAYHKYDMQPSIEALNFVLKESSADMERRRVRANAIMRHTYTAAEADPGVDAVAEFGQVSEDELGDWRRLREEAYYVNEARQEFLKLAVEAYTRNDMEVAKALSKRAAALRDRFKYLNLVAMRSLERERVGSERSVTVIDLHGFHVDEALAILKERIDLCRASQIPKLRIIIGKGIHSRQGKSTVYPAAKQYLESHKNAHITSIRPAEIHVSVRDAIR